MRASISSATPGSPPPTPSTSSSSTPRRALVNQLEAQVKADQAAIDNARAMLSYTDVVAPIAGRTGIRLIDEGNLVRAQDPPASSSSPRSGRSRCSSTCRSRSCRELNKGLAEGPLPVDALGPDGKSASTRARCW